MLANKSSKTVTFRVYRYTPEQKSAPKLVSYEVDTAKSGPMVIDGLNYIKENLDPSLSFRKACREGVCGSCAMNINGRNGLACIQKIRDHGKVITVRPLPHFKVVRDLVVDMDRFFEHHASVKPWLIRSDSARHIDPKQRELLQSQHERAVLDGLYECVLCGCCSGACPEYWWSEDSEGRFLGPSALQQAYRWVADSRDQGRAERLRSLKKDYHKIYNCHNIMNCSVACPKNLNPAKSVNKLRALVNQFDQ